MKKSKLTKHNPMMMMMNKTNFLSLLFFLTLPISLYSDREIEMPSFITASDHYVFAVAKPSEGVTKVYRVKDDQFKHLGTFDWIADEVFIKEVLSDVFLVRMNLYHEGTEARSEHVCLEFYTNGILTQTYSTLEIAGFEHGIRIAVERSPNLYSVVKNVVGFISMGAGKFSFQVVNCYDVNLIFELSSGKRIGAKIRESR